MSEHGRAASAAAASTVPVRISIPHGWVGYLVSLELLRLGLDLSYWLFVSPAFLDHFFLPMGWRFDGMRYALSHVVYLAGIVVASPNARKVSNLFYFIAIAFVFAPLTSMYGLDAGLSSAPVLASLVSMLIVRGLSAVVVGRTLRLRSLAYGDRLVVLTSVLAVATVVGWSVRSGAISLLSLSLVDIYLYRFELSRLMDVGWMAYLNIWTYKVFNVILFCGALLRGRYMLALAALALQVYFFGVTAHRMVLFLPVLSVGMWIFYRWKPVLSLLAVGVVGGLVLALVVAIRFDVFELGSIAIRRAFFVPAAATFAWFDYFEGRDLVLWTDNLLAGLFPSRYSGESLPLTLGEHLAPGVEISANNGFVSSGYAHAGYLGVVIYAVIFGLFSRACDWVARERVAPALMAAVLVGPVRTAWADSDLLTAMLSHGLIVGLFALWVYGRHLPRKPTPSV